MTGVLMRAALFRIAVFNRNTPYDQWILMDRERHVTGTRAHLASRVNYSGKPNNNNYIFRREKTRMTCIALSSLPQTVGPDER